MLSPNIDRWIFASVSKHFNDLRGTIPLFIEGMLRETNKLQEFIELRIDGPYYTEICKQTWKVYIEINVLCQCAMNSQNFHRMRQLTGNVMAMFSPCIPVCKYGLGVDDDGTSGLESIGALVRMDEEQGRNNLQVTQFGQVDPVNQLEQASVEAHYSMLLEE